MVSCLKLVNFKLLMTPIFIFFENASLKIMTTVIFACFHQFQRYLSIKLQSLRQFLENVMAVIFVSKDLDFHVKLCSKLNFLVLPMKYKQSQTILEKDPCQKWKKQWRNWRRNVDNLTAVTIFVSKVLIFMSICDPNSTSWHSE